MLDPGGQGTMARYVGQQVGGADHSDGRLTARPGKPGGAPLAAGARPLGRGTGRDGFLYLPKGYLPERPAPLALMLQGAGGNARHGLGPLQDLADSAGLILLAPDSRKQTWDVIMGGYGPDVAFIDRALEQAFSLCAVDPARLAVGGFSDGASYA